MSKFCKVFEWTREVWRGRVMKIKNCTLDVE